MRWGFRRAGAAIGLVGVVVSLASAAFAQDGLFRNRNRGRMPSADPAFERVEYDGRFAFVRLRYDTGGGFRREPPWAHDYPRAERHFMRILQEITLLKPHLDESNILALDDPQLFDYPWAYMSEPGFWTMTDAEMKGLQRYVQKGGFVVFDDFRGEHWYNFEQQIRRVFPEGRMIQLDLTNPIFHSFFEIKTLDSLRIYGAIPTYFGMFEDNDPEKRLLFIADYNGDIGEYMEFSDTGWQPIDLTNDAYKFAVNYVIYAMTH